MNFLTRLQSGRSLLVVATLLAAFAVREPVMAFNNPFNSPAPLQPEVAFSPEIESVEPGVIAIRYTIEDGYYLYRDKLAFSIADKNGAELAGTPAALKLGDPVFQQAGVIDDEYFGEQAIFRHTTKIVVPYRSDGSLDQFTLSIKYQGCADAGLCYPPNTISLDVQLPKAPAPSSSESLFGDDTPSMSDSSPVTASSRASDFLNDSVEPLLPPSLAFLPQVVSAHADVIDIRWFIEDGYFLYRDKISFTLEQADGLSVESGLIDAGVEKDDEFFGKVHVLRHSADARALLTGASDEASATQAPSSAILSIRYQGCADIGVCFPSTIATLPVSFSAGSSPAANDALVPMNDKPANSSGNTGNSVASSVTGDLATSFSNSEDNTSTNMIAVRNAAPATTAGSDTIAALTTATNNGSAPSAQSAQDRLTTLLGSASIWLTIATFFGLGLLLAFTPCVLPMVPILSSLIIGQGKSMSTARAFQLSAVYVLVMASTYALVGIAVGLSGYNVQAFLQNPVVLTGIAVLFVLLSLSMFGLYELKMPESIQNKLTQWSNKQGGGQFSGVAAMGFVSTLIVGPCVTAPLAGALLYIAKTGDALIGGTALFALGLGMGAPLLLIGTSAGKLLPKAGSWMKKVQHIFGILMLAMAIYMVSRFLPAAVSMAMYAVLAIVSGVYLGALTKLSANRLQLQHIGKGMGIALGLYGVALLAGALGGGGSYLSPLSAFTSANSTDSNDSTHSPRKTHSLDFVPVKSVADLNQLVAQASELGRPVMLDFYADWCVSCKEMDAFTFSDDRVQAQLSRAIIVQADVTANDKLDQELLKAFDLFGPPAIIFYDTNGNELRPARVVGFMNADNFSEHIQSFIGPADT